MGGGFIWCDFPKVVEENGDPKVIYHGSETKEITEFDNIFGRWENILYE
jgi:hypothetical protein